MRTRHPGIIVRTFIAAWLAVFAANVATAAERATLDGHVPAALAHASPLAPNLGAATEPLRLTIVLRRRDEAGFAALADAIKDPASPRFGRFVAQPELTARYGPTQDTYDGVARWLAAHGFALVAGSANRLTLTVEGTRDAAERAFGVRLRDYAWGERTFRANDRAPSVPAELAEAVQAVVGLSSLAQPARARGLNLALGARSQLQQYRAGDMALSCWLAWKMTGTDPLKQLKGTLKSVVEQNMKFTASAAFLTMLRYMCVADQLNMLNLLAAGEPLPTDLGLADPFSLPRGGGATARTSPPATEKHAKAPAAGALRTSVDPGAGQKIGLLEFDSFVPGDVQDYLALVDRSAQFALLSQVHIAGGAGSPGADQAEVLLDIDAAMSLAPGAQVIVYDGPFAGRGSFQTMFNAMIDDGVDVISNSWAYCEDQTTLADVQSLDAILAGAAASGITVVSSAGDRGSTCLDGSPNTVHVPASLPHVTAVGGTTMTSGLGGTYGAEKWWDGTTSEFPGGQSGFGVSRFFARPAYQNGINAGPMRSIPDVTAPADPANGYFICQASAGGCPTGLLYGGTSIAAPFWAAFVAVLNQQQNRKLGLLNPWLYPLAGTPAFHSPASMQPPSDFAHVGLGSPNLGRLHLALANGAAGAADPAHSHASAFPPEVVADGSDLGGVVIIVNDASGNTLDGAAVTVTANAGSAAVITPVNAATDASNGAARFTVTNTKPEVVTFTATVNGTTLAQHPTIKFVTAPAAYGSIGASPTTVTANWVDTTTITVTLKDAQMNPSAGKTITLLQGDGSARITTNSAQTNAAGIATFQASDVKAETVTFSAIDVTDGNLPVPGTAVVDFVNAPQVPCNVGLPTLAAGWSATTFVTSVPYDTYICVGPVGIAFAPDGSLVIVDYYDGNIYRFGPAGGAANLATRWSAALAGTVPAGIAFAADGRVYVARRYPTEIVELDPVSGAIVRTVASVSGPPVGLAIDPISGDLFYTYFDGVKRISNFANGPGTVTNYFTAGFTDGLVFAPDGTLYVKSGCCNDFVARVDGTGSATPGAYAIIASVDEGDGIGIEPNPAHPSQPFIYVNGTNGKLTRIDTSAYQGTTIDCTVSAACMTVFTNGSRGDFVTAGPDGCLYVTQADRVLKLQGSGGCALAPTFAFPQLQLAPALAQPSPVQGTPFAFTATVTQTANKSGIPVTLLSAGANPDFRIATTNAAGVATFTVTGMAAGLDTLVASATIDDLAAVSNSAKVTWTPGPHPTLLNLNASPGGGAPNLPVTLSAKLVDRSQDPPLPVAGAGIGFGVAGANCGGTTDAGGVATCTVTPTAAPGAYTLNATFAGSAQYRATSAASGFDLIRPSVLDIDLDGAYDPLTDGVLLTRWLFGYRGSALVADALGVAARRTDPVDIDLYLARLAPLLDVDGNGDADPLTDGLLIVRYLFGLRGAALTTGAVGTNAQRPLPADLETFIESLKP